MTFCNLKWVHQNHFNFINIVNKMVGKFDTIFENKIEMQAINQIRLAKKNFIFRNVMLD